MEYATESLVHFCNYTSLYCTQYSVQYSTRMVYSTSTLPKSVCFRSHDDVGSLWRREWCFWLLFHRCSGKSSGWMWKIHVRTKGAVQHVHWGSMLEHSQTPLKSRLKYLLHEHLIEEWNLISLFLLQINPLYLRRVVASTFDPMYRGIQGLTRGRCTTLYIFFLFVSSEAQVDSLGGIFLMCLKLLHAKVSFRGTMIP